MFLKKLLKLKYTKLLTGNNQDNRFTYWKLQTDLKSRSANKYSNTQQMKSPDDWGRLQIPVNLMLTHLSKGQLNWEDDWVVNSFHVVKVVGNPFIINLSFNFHPVNTPV